MVELAGQLHLSPQASDGVNALPDISRHLKETKKNTEPAWEEKVGNVAYLDFNKALDVVYHTHIGDIWMDNTDENVSGSLAGWSSPDAISGMDSSWQPVTVGILQ